MLNLHIDDLPDDKYAEQNNADSYGEQQMSRRRGEERNKMVRRYQINRTKLKHGKQAQHPGSSSAFRSQRLDFKTQMFPAADDAGEIGEHFGEVAADFLLHGEHHHEETNIRFVDAVSEPGQRLH